jgi:hypothetical protein
MLCQLLSISPLSLQPLSYLFGLRMPFSSLFLRSSPLLFPPTPAFFLPHISLLVLAATVFLVLLLDHLHLLTTSGFFLLPNCFRLLTTALFFFHLSYRLPLLVCDLPLASCLLGQQPPRKFLALSCRISLPSPLLCQPLPRGFPYDPALVVLRHCRPPRAPTPGLFSRLERHEANFRESPEHLISLPTRRWSQRYLLMARVSRVYPLLLFLCLWCGGWKRTAVEEGLVIPKVCVQTGERRQYRYL